MRLDNGDVSSSTCSLAFCVMKFGIVCQSDLDTRAVSVIASNRILLLQLSLLRGGWWPGDIPSDTEFTSGVTSGAILFAYVP